VGGIVKHEDDVVVHGLSRCRLDSVFYQRTARDLAARFSSAIR
jgi:hypothetical protein